MANLMSELERFEQEMKELGSKTVSQLLPPPPPPPLPPPTYAMVQGHLLPPPRPLTSRLVSNTTSTIPLTIPPPPPSRMPTLVALPQSIHRGPWINASPSPTTVTVKPTSSTPSIASLPQCSFITSSVTTTQTPTPIPLPLPPKSSTSFPISFHLQQQKVILHQCNGISQTTPHALPQTHILSSQSSVPSIQYQFPTLRQQLVSGTTTHLEPTIYLVPQQQQAQQLFQRDAQIITPEALEGVKAALASGEGEHKIETKKKAIPRKAAGQTWEDPILAEWPESDHRLFCGDLGNEVNDEVLTKSFSRFTTFNMARVVRDKRTGKTKGYGFVSFANPSDLALAFKEMNGRYVGNRPIKLRKSTWRDRTDTDTIQNVKHKKRQKIPKRKSSTSRKLVF